MNSVPSPRARQTLLIRHGQLDRLSSIGLQVRQPAIGGGKIPFAGCCRSITCWGRQQKLRRDCSLASGRCHAERDDLRFPRRNSQMPPLDIGCAASGSQFHFLLLNRLCDKVQCMPFCLKTHKVRYQIPPFEDFRHTCGGCPGDDRRTNSWGTACPLKWAGVHSKPTRRAGSTAKSVWIFV